MFNTNDRNFKRYKSESKDTRKHTHTHTTQNNMPGLEVLDQVV